LLDQAVEFEGLLRLGVQQFDRGHHLFRLDHGFYHFGSVLPNGRLGVLTPDDPDEDVDHLLHGPSGLSERGIDLPRNEEPGETSGTAGDDRMMARLLDVHPNPLASAGFFSSLF
jgi:hypothetical protein